jgi:ring-1,2-phenylacetyl-CoA epoxidase subunit PaaD
VVTAEDVRAALEDVHDPEIPVLSLIDLGVIRDVRVEGRRVHVELAPTFLGCPALEAMRGEIAARIAELGCEADVEVLRGDAWSTDLITAAGREKLRKAGFAPPLPRGQAPPSLVQLTAKIFRCPYCGSRETRLENVFGPTACRSIRYCDSCRQPFEQFKSV